jgi:hypothetical protein
MSMSAMDGIAYIAFDSYDGLRPYGLPISWLDTGHVAELVGIEGGVVSGVINLESSGA